MIVPGKLAKGRAALLDPLKPIARAAGGDGRRAETRLRIAATKIRTAVKAMPRNLSAGLGGVLLGVLGMSHGGASWQFQVDTPLLIWALATTAALCVCIALALRFDQADHPDAAALRAARPMVLAYAIQGACWGSAAWLLLPARTLEQDAFLLAGMALVLMGGAGAQAVYRPVLLAFTMSITLLFVTGMFRLGDPFHVMLAFGFLVYGVVALFYARNQELAMTRAIELALENQALLAERTQQEQAARQAHALAEQAREQAERSREQAEQARRQAEEARRQAEEARQQAEQARLQAEQAREQAEIADRAKTSFVAATSHDLRQPMHALVQYVAHLRGTCADAMSGPTISRIEESVAAMENLLDAVLDFSKISMGTIKPKIEVFPVERLLHSLDIQIRPIAQAKRLALRVEGRGGHVESDPVLLERVIRNVAQNAVRYTVAGEVVIRAVPHGPFVRVLVSDSGIGVPASEKTRIFDEYYQVDNRARDRRKGLGLGLAIVRDLARLLGLRVRLKSLPGSGSTFAIEVPAGLAPAGVADGNFDEASTQASGHSADYVRGALVVLIDDDPLALDGLRTTLADFGCRVIAASSGAEAVAMLSEAEFAPQVVVSDYRLANEENGLQAIESVLAWQRELYGEGFVPPALLITGDTSPDELARVARAGYPLLHKPVGPRRLFEALNTILRAAAEAQGQ